MSPRYSYLLPSVINLLSPKKDVDDDQDELEESCTKSGSGVVIPEKDAGGDVLHTSKKDDEERLPEQQNSQIKNVATAIDHHSEEELLDDEEEGIEIVRTPSILRRESSFRTRRSIWDPPISEKSVRFADKVGLELQETNYSNQLQYSAEALQPSWFQDCMSTFPDAQMQQQQAAAGEDEEYDREEDFDYIYDAQRGEVVKKRKRKKMSLLPLVSCTCCLLS